MIDSHSNWSKDFLKSSLDFSVSIEQMQRMLDEMHTYDLLDEMHTYDSYAKSLMRFQTTRHKPALLKLKVEVHEGCAGTTEEER